MSEADYTILSASMPSETMQKGVHNTVTLITSALYLLEMSCTRGAD